jgi:hypothetical protein
MSAPDLYYRRYLRSFLLFSTTGLLLVFAFNAWMDIYRVFGTPVVRGINAEKTGVDRHARIAKAYAVRDFAPQAVILGSSRAESAFDPAHPYFAGLKTYNLAFQGASVYEQYRYLQHATATGQLRSALVVIDLFQFLGGAQWVSEDFDEGRLALDVDGSPVSYPWRDVARLSLTGSAFRDSFRSLRHQRRKPSIYRADGYRDDSDDVPQMLKRPEGQRWEFVRSERGFLQLYPMPRAPMKSSSTVLHTAYEDLERMLRWGRANGVDIVLVIPPVHARHLEVIWRLGMWPELEVWKRRLVGIVADAAENQGCGLWDFSGYSMITTEALPQPGQVMRWWRESSHASSAAGNAVLDMIMEGRGRTIGEQLGRCLDRENIEYYLEVDRNAAYEWRRNYSEDAREIEAMQRELMPERGGANGVESRARSQ